MCRLGAELNVVHENINTAVVTATAAAKQARLDRAKTFLGMLRTAAPIALKEKLQARTGAEYREIDNEDIAVFDEIKSEILKVLPKLVFRPLQLNEQLEIVTSVVELLKSGSNNSATVRCTAACDICGALCCKPAGHVVSDATKLHDADHQPSGLIGRYWVTHTKFQNQLCYDSCTDSYNATPTPRFRHKDVWYSYKDYQTVFPSWSIPTVRSRSEVRELMFYHYHSQIAVRFGRTSCSEVPPAYNRDASALEMERKNRILANSPLAGSE